LRNIANTLCGVASKIYSPKLGINKFSRSSDKMFATFIGRFSIKNATHTRRHRNVYSTRYCVCIQNLDLDFRDVWYYCFPLCLLFSPHFLSSVFSNSFLFDINVFTKFTKIRSLLRIAWSLYQIFPIAKILYTSSITH